MIMTRFEKKKECVFKHSNSTQFRKNQQSDLTFAAMNRGLSFMSFDTSLSRLLLGNRFSYMDVQTLKFGSEIVRKVRKNCWNVKV